MNDNINSTNTSKWRQSKWAIILLWICFFGVLLMIEVGPYSSKNLGKYNNGYGTFDMKSYDTNKVVQVLDNMQQKGFAIYRGYFVFDYLFIIVFGAVQIYLTSIAYGWCKNRKIVTMLSIVPVARGIFDLIENTLLLIVIQSYPNVLSQVITVASSATWLKLLMIRVWSAIFIIGIVGSIYHRNKKS